MTEEGVSIIVPIRIDVDIGIEAYNYINTMFDAYNPEYVADLLRDGNVLYTRDGKSISELLSQRREVPKSHSSDASIVSISIPSEKQPFCRKFTIFQQRSRFWGTR